jgi:hypothetical protein
MRITIRIRRNPMIVDINTVIDDSFTTGLKARVISVK